MALDRRGVAPVDITLGDRNVLRITLGDRLIWDGTTPVTIVAPPLRARLALTAPMLSIGVQPESAVLAAVTTMPAPEIRAGAGIVAPASVLAAEIPGPTLSVGVTVAAPPLAAHLSMPAPAVGETVVDAPPLAAALSLPAASVVAGVTAGSDPFEATLTAPQPDISAGVTVVVPPLAAAVSMPAAEVMLGVTYADDFNRASLGTDWTVLGSLAPVISGGDRVQAGTGGPINTTSAYPARRTAAVTSDNHRSGGHLMLPSGSANLNHGVGLFVRGTSGGDRVEAVVTPTAVTFFTKTGGTGGTSTSRHTQSGLSIATGAFVDLAATGATYTVYADGVAVASWTDAGGIIPIDANHRMVGIAPMSNRNFSSSYTYGWALDDWVGRDG